MAGGRKPRRRAAKPDEHETASTVIGLAYEISEHALNALAMTEETPVDFQARQDSIAETRRGPDSKLAPKLKRTRARPARARETNLKL